MTNTNQLITKMYANVEVLISQVNDIKNDISEIKDGAKAHNEKIAEIENKLSCYKGAGLVAGFVITSLSGLVSWVVNVLAK